jgi:hypothetical protein
LSRASCEVYLYISHTKALNYVFQILHKVFAFHPAKNEKVKMVGETIVGSFD